MAAMFLRCGSHPLSGAEIPPTLRPSPASRKPSSTAHCTKCLLRRPPGAPRDLKPVTVRNSSVDDPRRVLQPLPPHLNTRAGAAYSSPGQEPPRAPPRAGGSCVHQLHSSRHSRAGLYPPAAGVVVQGDRDLSPVWGLGVPYTGRREGTAAFRSCLPLLLPQGGSVPRVSVSSMAGSK